MDGLNMEGALTLGGNNGRQTVNYGLPEVTQADEAAAYLRAEREKERERSERGLAAFALGVGKGGVWEKDYQKDREAVSELNYLDSSAANAVPGHRSQMLGFEVARRLGDGDTWSTAQKVIAAMPKEKRMEWEKKLDNCMTRAEGEVVLGDVFTAFVRGNHEKAAALHEQAEADYAKFGKELEAAIPQAVRRGGSLDAGLWAKVTKYGEAEEVSTALTLAQNAMRRVENWRGSKGELEADVYNLAWEYEREYLDGVHFSPGEKKTWEDFMQQARSDKSKGYRDFSRRDLLGIANMLSDENGELNETALNYFLVSLKEKAREEQSIDSKFLRNLATSLSDTVYDSADWAVRLFQDKTGIYSPKVERLRAHLADIDGVRLRLSPKSGLAKSLFTDMGGILGNTAPAIVAGAMTGGEGALSALYSSLASGAALAPALMNQGIRNAYRDKKTNPELTGSIEGAWNAAAEGLFGSVFRTVPLTARVLDYAALKSLSVPALARSASFVHSHVWSRYGLGILAETSGELVLEGVIANTGQMLTADTLQAFGVKLDDVEFNPFGEFKGICQDESQLYATIAFCAGMGLLGLPANMRAARDFASNERVMRKVGLKKSTASRIASTHSRGLITTEEANEQMRDAFIKEVIHGDQNEVLKRLQAEKELTLSEVEAATLAQGNLHKAALKLLGVLEREKRGDKNVLHVVDKVKYSQDAQKWEKDEDGQPVRPAEYEMPMEEVEMSDEQLIAFMRHGLKEQQINLMKRLRSAALADNAAGKLNAREDRGVNVYALSSELMKSEDGRALMGEAATEAQFTGAMTPRILGKISTAAQAEMQKGASALVKHDSGSYLPASALPALVGVKGTWGGRVEFAKSQGERADGTNAFRMNGERGVSDILFNAGHATLPEIAEETMESMLYRAAHEMGGIDENQNWNDKGRELLHGVAADLQAAREQVHAMTGVDIMPGLDIKKANEPMHVIEHFSHFAQSDFYRNADRYELSEEAMRNVQFVDSALLSADLLKRADKGWQTFIKSDKGKAWMAQGGTLQGLLRNAGLAVASIYQEAYVTTENALVAAEAAASLRGLSIADVMELEEQVKAEDAERDAASSTLVPEPPEETVEGVEPPPNDGSEAATFSGSEFVVPEGSRMLIAPEGKGRGLVGGIYAPNGDGSAKGMARVADIYLSQDVPQFKRKSDTGAVADEDGTTYKLSGGYNQSAPDIVVWRRKDGRLEVITGRHRLAHARANGLEEINVRVYDEDAAHDAKWAKLYDVEANILDRSASVQDVAYFFRNTDMSEAEAEARGLMQKAVNGEVTATGRMGITIARRACDEVFTRFMNGALTREQAYFIATLGVEEKGQELAAQLFAKGKKMDWVKAYVREAEKARAASDAPMQFDLFGANESWAQEASKVADYVAKARKQAKGKLDILSKAGKLKDKQKAAKELGVTLKTSKDVAKTQQRLILLDAALERMDSTLNLGERAAAWDGKSAINLDGLRVSREGVVTFSSASLPLTPEMKEIKKRAIADGQIVKNVDGSLTFLAPNSRPSNLTEWQWLQVRTAAFKNWFGDWETLAKIRAVRELPTVSVDPHKKLEKSELMAAFQGLGTVINSRNKRAVVFPNKTAGKVLGHQGYNISSIAGSLGELFESAVPAFELQEEKKEGHKFHPNYERYENYVNKFSCDGETYYVRFTVPIVRNEAPPHKVHSVAVSDVRIYKEGDPVLTLQNNAGNLSLPFVDTRLADFFASVNEKDVSKVVDENGEPLVVYHGSDADFNVFDPTKGRANMDIQGMFFSPWDIDASGYGGNVRAFFLNIRKPAKEWQGYSALRKFAGQNGAGVKARELLKEQGFDGVNNEGEEYIAFASTQIKSASDNRGTFDPQNPDITFSTTSLSAVFGAIATDIKEESMRRLLNSVEQALYRWKSGFSGRDEKVGYDKLAQEMGKLMATAMGVYRSLPAGYRVRLDPMLRKGAVFARMMEEGKVLSYGQVNKEERAALTEKVMETLREDYPEFYTDSPEWTLKSKEAWEAAQKEATAAVGREEMVRMYEEIAAEAVGAVRRYLKDEELRKLDRLLESLQPRMDSHSRRFRRSNIGVATHDKVVHLAELMEMTPEEQQELLEQLEADIKTAETAGEETKGLELGEEYGNVLAFGALRSRGYEDIRAARASLVSLVSQSATPWRRKLEREANKAKAIRLRVIRAIGSPDEMRKKEIVERERNSFWTKLRNLPAYTMSMTQLFDSMTAIPGLDGWAEESCAAVVAGHKALVARQNDGSYSLQKFMVDELGLDTETKRNDFMAGLKKKEDTGITPLSDMVVYDESIPYALATEWAMMTPKDRQVAREAWETTNEGMQPLPEAAVATLREQLAQAKPGANVYVRVEYRSDKVKLPLKINRDQALDIVLRCEQEGYQHNADMHGYTPEVLQKLRDFCGEKVMKLGYFMRKRFNRSGVAQAFEEREGVPFPSVENYWPGNFDLTSKGDKDKNALDSSGMGSGTRYGMTKTRVKHNLTFDLTMGATNSFMAGMAMADNYVCFGGLTQQCRSLLANDAFSRRLREHMGEARFSALKDGLNMLDNQGITEAYAQRAMSSLVSRVQSAHAPAVLAGSLTTMFKQVSALLHGSAYPGVSAARLMGQLLADRVGNGRMTYSKMMQEPIFAERRRSANKQAWEEMLTLGTDVKWSRLVAWSRCGMNTLERIDTASNCVSMTALYNVLWKQAEQSAREAGTPLDEAATHEACMRAVELTLEEAAMPLTKSQRSLLQACGGQGVWGNLNMYMAGEVLNKVGLVVSKWHKAGGGWKGFWAAWPFLVSMSASQQMLCMVIDLLRGKDPDDEDEWLMWLASNLATGITGAGLLNGAPLLGDFISLSTAGYARTDTMADVLGMDFWNYTKRVVKMTADDKEHSATEWGVGLGNLLRVVPTGLGLLGGGTYSTIQWVSTGTGLLQSANAAYNIVRLGFDRARNSEKKERKRKKTTAIPKL